MRADLWGDPRVSRLCEMTGSGTATVIGALYWLWSTADQHADADGMLRILSLRGIDHGTGIPDFGRALELIGWIDECTNGVLIMRFDEHGSDAAKKRAMSQKRKEKQRCHAPGVTEVGQKQDISMTTARQKEASSRTDGGQHRDVSVTPAPIAPKTSGLAAMMLSQLDDA